MNKDNESVPILSVLGDGAISIPEFGDGRLIPVLLLDSEGCNTFNNLVSLHSDSGPGDAVIKWGKERFNSRFVHLQIAFSKPALLKVSIKLDLRTQYAVADAIVQARGVYLQPARRGDKVSNSINNQKIVVEVPPKTKLKDWDNLLLKQVEKKLRLDGCSKKESKEIAIKSLNSTRELWLKRRTNT